MREGQRGSLRKNLTDTTLQHVNISEGPPFVRVSSGRHRNTLGAVTVTGELSTNNGKFFIFLRSSGIRNLVSHEDVTRLAPRCRLFPLADFFVYFGFDSSLRCSASFSNSVTCYRASRLLVCCVSTASCSKCGRTRNPHAGIYKKNCRTTVQGSVCSTKYVTLHIKLSV